MSKTIARHIRIDADHWRRIEALEHREWPQNPIEVQMHRSCLFTAQATARDMISTGRRDEVKAVRRETSFKEIWQIGHPRERDENDHHPRSAPSA